MSLFSQYKCKICSNICYVIYVLLWIKYCLMWFESLLVFIVFKKKKRPNISGIQVVLWRLYVIHLQYFNISWQHISIKDFSMVMDMKMLMYLVLVE